MLMPMFIRCLLFPSPPPQVRRVLLPGHMTERSAHQLLACRSWAIQKLSALEIHNRVEFHVSFDTVDLPAVPTLPAASSSSP